MKRISRKAIRAIRERDELFRRKLVQRKTISPSVEKEPDAHVIAKEDWYPGDDVYEKLLSR
jgi:hypothetical protein